MNGIALTFLGGMRMKRIWIIVLLVLLTGCSTPAAMETVTDVYIEPTMGQMQQVMLDLPQDVAVPVRISRKQSNHC